MLTAFRSTQKLEILVHTKAYVHQSSCSRHSALTSSGSFGRRLRPQCTEQRTISEVRDRGGNKATEHFLIVYFLFWFFWFASILSCFYCSRWNINSVTSQEVKQYTFISTPLLKTEVFHCYLLTLVSLLLCTPLCTVMD